MLVGTHALLPVCICLATNRLAKTPERERIFPLRSMWAVGFFGILPDICSPHISLEARHLSWSHTVAFMLALIVIVGIVGLFFKPGIRLRVAIACWGAAALHLAADAVSGGIPWLYPWSHEILGGGFIPFEYWIVSDAFFVILAWLLLRANFKKR